MGETITILIAVIAALFFVYFINVAMAKPKGQDLKLLTSSAPDETIIYYSVCNAQLKDAEPNAIAEKILEAFGAQSVGQAIKLVSKMAGGLWVGGRVIITSHRVVFIPNRMNKLVHEPLSTIAFILPDVLSVSDRFGILTRIVDFQTQSGCLSVRLFNTQALVDTFEKAKSTALLPQ